MRAVPPLKNNTPFAFVLLFGVVEVAESIEVVEQTVEYIIVAVQLVWKKALMFCLFVEGLQQYANRQNALRKPWKFARLLTGVLGAVNSVCLPQ